MTRHSIDDYGHVTQTAPAMITDEWAAQHLPLAQVALAAAVPLIEAEVREKVAREIEALGHTDECETGAWDDRTICHCTTAAAVRIARGAK